MPSKEGTLARDWGDEENCLCLGSEAYRYSVAGLGSLWERCLEEIREDRTRVEAVRPRPAVDNSCKAMTADLRTFGPCFVRKSV